MTEMRSVDGRWEIEVRLEIKPKHVDIDEHVFEDAATMRYLPALSSRDAAVEFLRAMADEIETGTLQEGPLLRGAKRAPAAP